MKLKEQHRAVLIIASYAHMNRFRPSVRAELGPGDGEREDPGPQTGRLGQKPAELHLQPPAEQPVGEQVVSPAPQRPADLRGRPHHSGQEPAGLAGPVNMTGKCCARSMTSAINGVQHDLGF